MEAVNFYIIHLSFLIIAEFIWGFFVFFIILKILREKEILFSKKFYYFIVSASLFSVLINRLFEYAVNDMPIASEIWAKIGSMERLGIVLVPTFFLMYIYFYLASGILSLRAREVLFIALVLGMATAPWRILL